MKAKKRSGPVKVNLFSWHILIPVAAACVVYLPTLKNDFVNWDDIVYIMNNDMITSFSWKNLQKVFSTYFMGNYHPFILLSFTFDFQLFKFSPAGYHFHNLVLHMVNTLLVYAFIFRFTSGRHHIALITALLFALHPMHVESVAWVSERKDLLYTAWFLASALFYMRYNGSAKPVHLLLSLVLFLFSLLSKAQAVTLPLVLFLIDFYHKKPFTLRSVGEKVPFLVLSLIFGIVAIFAQDASGYINPLDIPVWESLFYAPYAIVVYLLKFPAPLLLTAVYEYPLTAGGTVPWYVFLSPLILPALGYLIYRFRKEHHYIAMGLLFFLLTIFPVLQFLPVGGAVVAERYTYVPYIGLGLLVAFLFEHWLQSSKPDKRQIIRIAGVTYLLILAFLTYERTKIWQNSITLWSDVMKKDPGCVQAYINRAYMYNEQKEYEKALQDCTNGLALDPGNFTLYKNRGIAYGITGRYDLAKQDYSEAIRHNPEDWDSYLYRGILYTDRFSQLDSGIMDFRKYLTYQPDNENANFNMGVAFFRKRDMDSAVYYFTRVSVINPSNQQATDLIRQIKQITETP